MAQPDPGIALNPPVPHPQFIKIFLTGRRKNWGPITSHITIPPHQRSILSREMIGNVSINALTVSSTW